jgi:hypothetical protein
MASNTYDGGAIQTFSFLIFHTGKGQQVSTSVQSDPSLTILKDRDASWLPDMLINLFGKDLSVGEKHRLPVSHLLTDFPI